MGIISGIFDRSGFNASLTLLEKMLHCQSHRDPTGVLESYVDEGLVIGGINHFDHRIDGYRPSVFVDGIVLVEESEHLSTSLQNVAAISFSEAVYKAYRRWGLEFMNHLDGEFSCALWDPDQKTLILARDPFGHKPLHYHCSSTSLYFSSEIKGILQAGVLASIDLTSLSDFLTLNCIPYPSTIFKDIFQVPPGAMLIYDSSGYRIKRWWQPEMAEDKDVTQEEAVFELSEELKKAVSRRLLKDDTYCFLSGGIDSSAIVSYATELAMGKIHAVSVGFEEEEENELEDAAIMASHVGAAHYPLIVKPDSFFDMLDVLVSHHDSPFTDTSAYPTYFAARAGASLTDIILTGDGPDQLMAGSNHYVFAAVNDIFASRAAVSRKIARAASIVLDKCYSDPVPSLFSKAGRKLYRESLPPVHAAYDLRSYFPDIVKKYLCTSELWNIHCEKSPYRHPDKWFREAGNADDINRYLYADMEFYLPDDLMIKVDRMCMAHGLETLSPFLDKKLVNFINRLPGDFKLRQEDGEVNTKYILKEVCRKRFPPEILNKRKQGFGIPLEKWLKQDNGRMVRDILLDPVALKRPYFRKEAMENLVNVFLQGKGDYFFPSPNAIAGLLTFELWHRKYLD